MRRVWLLKVAILLGATAGSGEDSQRHLALRSRVELMTPVPEVSVPE